MASHNEVCSRCISDIVQCDAEKKKIDLTIQVRCFDLIVALENLTAGAPLRITVQEDSNGAGKEYLGTLPGCAGIPELTKMVFSPVVRISPNFEPKCSKCLSFMYSKLVRFLPCTT
jgi:hypothetical protein